MMMMMMRDRPHITTREREREAIEFETESLFSIVTKHRNQENTKMAMIIWWKWQIFLKLYSNKSSSLFTCNFNNATEDLTQLRNVSTGTVMRREDRGNDKGNYGIRLGHAGQGIIEISQGIKKLDPFFFLINFVTPCTYLFDNTDRLSSFFLIGYFLILPVEIARVYDVGGRSLSSPTLHSVHSHERNVTVPSTEPHNLYFFAKNNCPKKLIINIRLMRWYLIYLFGSFPTMNGGDSFSSQRDISNVSVCVYIYIHIIIFMYLSK